MLEAWVPRLTAPQPNASLPVAGLRLLNDTDHAVVFEATPALGTYNHGAHVTAINGTVISSWHNCARDEDAPGCRVLYALSTDGGLHWLPPQELFPRLSPPLDPNATANASVHFGANVYATGFQSFDGRLYAFAGVKNNECSASCRVSHTGLSDCCQRCRAECCPCAANTNLPLLVRALAVPGGGGAALSLGGVHWLARAAQLSGYNLSVAERAIPSYEQGASQLRADAEQYNAQKLRVDPPAPPLPAALSERSVFVQAWQAPGTAPGSLPGFASDALFNLSVVALLRDDGGSPPPLREWASRCALLSNRSTAAALASASARGQDMLLPGGGAVHPPLCDWSLPVLTNIPDSRSATCAGVLPTSNGANRGAKRAAGGHYSHFLLGSQLPKLWLRDPLTIALSAGGVDFSALLAVRAGAPPARFAGSGKGPGFEYPMAVVVGEEGGEQWLLTVYSVNKEDIAATRIPLPLTAD
jgi:hypothetical protein